MASLSHSLQARYRCGESDITGFHERHMTMRRRMTRHGSAKTRHRLIFIGCVALMVLLGSDSSGFRDQRMDLDRAAQSDDVVTVRALIRSGADVNLPNEQGRTPLMNAAAAGRLSVVQALIEAQADVDASDRNGLTALMEASRLDRVGVVRALLDAGADPNLRHREYGTALDLAERQGYRELASLLRSKGARGSGKSEGDLVCVRVWDGAGYCGTVMAIENGRWLLCVTRLVGCEKGCAPDACSLGRPVGGDGATSVEVGDELRIDGDCLTHTGLDPESR
jgi:hypothetical protein